MKLKGFLTLVALLTVAGVVYSIRSQMTPKPLRSFMVTTIMSSPQKGSPYLITSTLVKAVRTDGSWVEIWTRNIGGQDKHERDIHDFKNGMVIVVEDATQSVVRKSIPPDEYKHRLAPAVSCEGSPAGQILGVDVNYAETTQKITGNEQGDATELDKVWVVPDLGCFVLQKETIWTRNSDGVLLVDTKITPISMSFQQVDEFFEIPTSYTERTKEKVLSLLNK
jgi:hypothetical protein